MSGSSGNIYSPSGGNLADANSAYSNLIPQAVNQSNSVAAVPGQVSNLTSAAVNNPYAAPAQAGANAAGAYGTGTVVPQQQQGAAQLAGAGGAAAGYVPQALATGFDPQNGLYNRQFQQAQDQGNAIAAMSGVSGTPYAAGVAQQGAQNFNLDWLNSQQAREGAAANTAATLTGAANTGLGGASSLGQQAIQTQIAASGLPSSTYMSNITDTLKALIGGNTAAGGAAQITDQAMSQILSYLGYGTGATQAQQKESDSTFAGLGSGLGALAGLGTSGGGSLGAALLGF